jgi:hypothetical protein
MMERMDMSASLPSQFPEFWDLLPEADKAAYNALKQRLQPGEARPRPSSEKRPVAFERTLKTIRQYVSQGDGNELKRSLVCGVVWLDDAIAIHTAQLSKLSGKSKSALNGGFTAMGYATVPPRIEHARALHDAGSSRLGDACVARQWTIRERKGAAGEKADADPLAIDLSWTDFGGDLLLSDFGGDSDHDTS